MAHDTWHTLAV